MSTDLPMTKKEAVDEYSLSLFAGTRFGTAGHILKSLREELEESGELELASLLSNVIDSMKQSSMEFISRIEEIGDKAEKVLLNESH